MAYDQAKAEAFNRARAQGLSQADALAAAGIATNERFSYAVGTNGQLGPRSQVEANLGQRLGTTDVTTAAGSTDSQGRPVQVLSGQAAAQARAEEAAFEQTGQLPVTPYAQTASPAPGTITRREYTEESTTSISGGGSTTIVATPGRPTPASQALDAQAQQTQREIEALQLANSGLAGPELSEAQQTANDARILELQQQYNSQRDAAEAAKTPTPPSITTVPNTTTTINSVSYERSVEVTPVNASDPAAQTVIAREAGTDLAITRTTVVPAGVGGETDQALAPPAAEAVAEVDVAAPAGVNSNQDEALQTFDGPADSGEIAETGLAEPLDVDSNEDEALQTFDDGAIGGEIAETGLREPPDVDPNEDEAFRSLQTPDGEEEAGAVAETGLREPTAEDVAAAEQNAAKTNAINQATLQSRYKQPGNKDWRVRLSLAPTSDYLYNAGGNDPNAPGILAPLRTTNGVVFPYTPTVSTTYQANYEQYDLVHSNYRGLYYKNSRVGDISVRGMFTAQDTTEANYLLAVIHFFRSVTKMFYGQDANRGVPPPLVFLSGFGNFQFSDHPCVVTSFNYTLPNDVDYIRATNFNNYGGNLFNRRAPIATAPGGVQFAGAIRLANALLPKNAQPQVPTQNTLSASVTNTDRSTYVPTKMEIDISLIPVQTRDQVSNQFSLKEFANGNLIKKGFW
jgi:hypothetical protein